MISHEVSAAMSLIDGLSSKDHSIKLESATKINRFLLSQAMQGNRILNIEDLIRSGVVARFAYLLHYEDYPKLQCEAARGLAIFAAYIPDVVVDHNVVPILVTLVAYSRDYYVRQQAIWALGTVAYHRRHRDYVLKCGALRPLLSQLYKDTNLSMLRIATWTVSNLCHGMPPPTFDEVKPALEIHLNSSDEQVLRYVCCAIAFLCDGSEDGIQSVIEAGFVPKLVKILRHPSKYVLGPVLHTIGTIVTGNNHQSQSVIDANLIPPLVNLAQNAEFEIKKEAVCAISNATVGGSPNQIKYLVEQGCIKPLCDLLVCSDVKIISACLEGLEKILNVGEAEQNIGEVNNYCQLIEGAEGLEKIENLQKHESEEIYDKALKILETYWDVEEDDEETQQPPR